MAAAPDDDLADWLDAIAWLCWTETVMGRYASALAHFDRAIAIARRTGQGYIISNLLAGQAQVLIMFGRLEEASWAAEEAAEVARMLGSGHQLVFALAQQCLAASWSGDDQAAVRLGEDAVRTGENNGEWSGTHAHYALAVALINAGRREAGRSAMAEVVRRLEPAQARPAQPPASLRESWPASKPTPAIPPTPPAGPTAPPGSPTPARKPPPGSPSPTRPARPSRRPPRPPRPKRPSSSTATASSSTPAGPGSARASRTPPPATRTRPASNSPPPRARSPSAAPARSRPPPPTRPARSASGLGARSRAKAVRVTTAYGLTQRELEVVKLVGEGYTNQQIAESLHLSSRTVETHLAHIFAKLKVTSRTGILKVFSERD